jgi:hypothetical protein
MTIRSLDARFYALISATPINNRIDDSQVYLPLFEPKNVEHLWSNANLATWNALIGSTSTRYMLMRCIPMGYTLVGVDAREILAYEVHAHEMYACEIHAYKAYAYEVHAREVHAHKVHPVGCTPIKYTPMR